MIGTDDVVRLVYFLHPISLDMIVTMLYRFTPTVDQVQDVEATIDVLRTKQWINCSSSETMCHKYMLSTLGQTYLSTLIDQCPTLEPKTLLRFKELTKREDVRNHMQASILSALPSCRTLTEIATKTGMEHHVCHMLTRRLERLQLVAIHNDTITLCP